MSSQVYKSKTEAAKKEYLKALAAYRASLVSKVRNCFLFSPDKCVTLTEKWIRFYRFLYNRLCAVKWGVETMKCRWEKMPFQRGFREWKFDILSPSRLQQNRLRPRLSAPCSRLWPPPVCPQAWYFLPPSTSTPPCHRLPRPSNKSYHGPLPQSLCRWD